MKNCKPMEYDCCSYKYIQYLQLTKDIFQYILCAQVQLYKSQAKFHTFHLQVDLSPSNISNFGLSNLSFLVRFTYSTQQISHHCKLNTQIFQSFPKKSFENLELFLNHQTCLSSLEECYIQTTQSFQQISRDFLERTLQYLISYLSHFGKLKHTQRLPLQTFYSLTKTLKLDLLSLPPIYFCLFRSQ
ncbi:hypothetical protein TTHERM_000807931 (macronuclear) [Tetrahymena thermophila SB210]|uniref:Uncharacterized protein n=1 Tax=Tetrahymena thermophila (strain SB210) TaxID=312017 RepID=W7X7V3_TETTS|nr:hypothetical protein TTHERM_000807931 [Tetrahymena thermophila SB210]EWS75455.1 hypothetical protein TTHERM_000807931 [Tetrahymena thermophila SB210]|eukprot:XP_012652002.1 hypothetical protein TTHERM_000807931 [Tetrahymena thermophila SB210]